jgi:hypothetical protein
VIADIKAAIPIADVDPVKNAGDVGKFVSEYMAYHVVWYQSYVNEKFPDTPAKNCRFAGHTHVGIKVSAANGENAVKVQLRTLIEELGK